MAPIDRRKRRIDEKLPDSGGGAIVPPGGGATPAGPATPTPAAPQNVRITSTFLIFSAVTPSAGANVTWTPPPGIASPDSYTVQWATDSGFTSPTTRVTGRGQTSITLDGLPVSTTIYVRVAARVGLVLGAWSATASDTTPSDTTPPAAPTDFAYTWSGRTGDLTLSWTNPTSPNFRDVRVRIYASNGGALLREVHAASPPYVWTLAQHLADTSNTPDPAVYVVLTARSWGGVYSATDLTGSPTLAAPSAPAGLTSSWASDDGTAGADLLVTWTRSDQVASYELTLNSTARLLGNTDRYLLALQQNAAENAGTADPSISVSLKARDALGQLSTAAALTATNVAPPATTIASVFAGTSTVGLTITPSTARDLKHYRVQVIKGASIVDTIYVTDTHPVISIEDGSGSYQFNVAAVDRFDQVGITSDATSAVDLIDWATFVADLRAEVLYSDSISTSPATLAGLKDGNRVTGVVTYAGGTTWKWTQADWQKEITVRPMELAVSETTLVYFSFSLDGATWTYYYGGSASGGVYEVASSTSTEATAQSGAVNVSAGTWRVELPAPRVARYIRVHHRRLAGAYALMEWFPANLGRFTLIEAEGITAYHIAAGAITGDRLTATAIDGFVITGATVRSGSGSTRIEFNSTQFSVINSGVTRVTLDTTGLKTYDASGVVQVEATTATDGQLSAGGGAVLLNADGIEIPAASSSDPLSAYKFTSANAGFLGLFAHESSSEITETLFNWSNKSSRMNFSMWATDNTDFATVWFNIARGTSGISALSVVDFQIVNKASASRVEISGAGLHVGTFSETAIAEGNVKIDGGINVGSATGAATGAIRASGNIFSAGRFQTSNWDIHDNAGAFDLNNGAVRFRVASNGTVGFYGPTSGTAGALQGWLSIQVGGTSYKIPYYAV